MQKAFSTPGPDLTGQTALITGAALGIGRATAIRLAEAGADLVLVDIDEAELATTIAMLPHGTRHLEQIADVTSENDVAALYGASADFAPIEILVNNVGGGRSGRIWDLSVEDWDYTMRLSLRSMFLCTRAFLPGMIERGYGRVVCLSSGARNGTVWNARPLGACAYSTAKAGVVGFVRDLAIELGDNGVTINAVAPGPIDTERAGPYLRELEVREPHYSPSRHVPMGRLGSSGEVAEAIAFLASRGASYITGTTLDVAGGR